MPRKAKLSIFQDEHIVKTDAKKPTLRQWLKEQPKDANPSAHIVRVIWLPRQWDNFTLECDAFRVSVKRTDSLYSKLGNELDALVENEIGMELLVSVSDGGIVRINPLESVGKWRYITDLGVAFEPQESDAH